MSFCLKIQFMLKQTVTMRYNNVDHIYIYGFFGLIFSCEISQYFALCVEYFVRKFPFLYHYPVVYWKSLWASCCPLPPTAWLQVNIFSLFLLKKSCSCKYWPSSISYNNEKALLMPFSISLLWHHWSWVLYPTGIAV